MGLFVVITVLCNLANATQACSADFSPWGTPVCDVSHCEGSTSSESLPLGHHHCAHWGTSITGWQTLADWNVTSAISESRPATWLDGVPSPPLTKPPSI